ncbi:hypothetical protein CYLTODRAFT_411176 [Cylindrobasidium torrendii FP15055 ss-10]|uniref:Uncharacterized protein n=1 Tax=Cylindrobasidium torrendii FP15055 ss-10 TaxID=1314674 RepID=A0A0D7BAT6_9AGAR|nr:hypothetical protein CYLTODRAFT_411176 [Cylindrobasidium torrendii FP15055 ss-10]
MTSPLADTEVQAIPPRELSPLLRLGLFAAIATPIAAIPYILHRRSVSTLRRQVHRLSADQERLGKELQSLIQGSSSRAARLYNGQKETALAVDNLTRAAAQRDSRVDILSGRVDAMTTVFVRGGLPAETASATEATEPTSHADSSAFQTQLAELSARLNGLEGRLRDGIEAVGDQHAKDLGIIVDNLQRDVLAQESDKQSLDLRLKELESTYHASVGELADSLKAAIGKVESLSELTEMRTEMVDLAAKVDQMHISTTASRAIENDFYQKVDALSHKIQEVANDLHERATNLESADTATAETIHSLASELSQLRSIRSPKARYVHGARSSMYC